MPDRLSNRARYALATAALTVFAGATLFLNFNNPKHEIEKSVGEAFVKTDSTPGYDIEKVRRMFTLYTPQDFEAHKRFLTRHDLVYPLCYAIPSALLLWLLWSTVTLECHRALRWLAVLLPLAVMVFDYAENYTMYNYLSAYPKAPLDLLQLSRTMTDLKWLLVLLSNVMLYSGILMWLRDRRSGCRH